MICRLSVGASTLRACITLALLAAPGTASAKVFDVAAGDVYGRHGLVAAITEANGNGQNNTIILRSGSTYRLRFVDNDALDVDEIPTGPNGLPAITGVITITNDNGGTLARTIPATIERDAAASPFRIFYVAPTGILRLINVVVQGGLGGGDFQAGGGLYNRGAATLLYNCLIRNNASMVGGGIFNEARGVLRVLRTDIRDNVAAFNASGGFVSGGGGIYNSGELTLTDTTISRNSSTGGIGGGLFNEFNTAMATLNRSTVSYHLDAGGIFNSDGGLTISNSTISRNHSPGGGGGIHNQRGDSVLDLNNVTITENDATVGYGGGGLYNSSTSATIRNSIIAGNTLGGLHVDGADCWGNLHSVGYNLLGEAADCFTFVATTGDQVGVAAGLGPLQDNGGFTQTHALVTTPDVSRAIDAANPSAPGSSDEACRPFDQRLFRRPADGPNAAAGTGPCDVGSFEFGMRVVNDLLSGPTSLRLNTVPRGLPTFGCPEGFVRYNFTGLYRNADSRAVLSDLVLEVAQLSNGNILWNADVRPESVKGRLTVPLTGRYGDGLLGPGESVAVPFVFCLRQNRPFGFAVDAFGIVR